MNRVFYLDANRQVIDIYNMNWKNYLRQRVADEERRKKERVNVEKKATALQLQAARFGAKASKAAAAHQMVARAEKMLSGLDEVRQDERVAKLRFPKPAPAARRRSWRRGCRSRTGRWRSSPTSTSPSTAARASSSWGSTAPARRRCCVSSRASTSPTPGSSSPVTASRSVTTHRSTRNLDVSRSVLDNMMSAAPHITATEARKVLGSFLFVGDDVLKPAGVLSGGEKTRLSLATLVVSSANMLLLDEPTNNLDPASREEILGALAHYEGAVVLVSHDEGAVEALNPERVLILPTVSKTSGDAITPT